ncbi:DUF1559 domain-containing protein [Tuwongella immobilis]|uniref:DUF1559 domain-containing protein n=1 Tax=Tuwongella immobilis TaxID=692036 RepID=A0A6C2YUX9_9BACT|nr:DUF1559 domain-containing protein [Tuwongella immobilis]VIP05167.1 Uncharacterized protein OS=Planctomyces limnophilus (strain ATCC 43296 / DSM 3776 / IFAM 1008 / 290) GN=Plim_3197 PE=4 SV=1: N_methyl_2: SBP_bac_10 [Tuwongella immobilis]VTS07690.1 Uncharacterized protein OS=Planctomyces limnophilus (strain ATCC 43296 / DSM 3776 / IFAM 1008 / 290) GN=Plim_3197 PE=4 SV=1: N_methyl_2: SBP_bac_10 [Tuwongella immobilis]
MKRTPRMGFTLIELLVVISIIGILLGLLLSAVQSVRSAASKLACANNLKQIGLAAHAYESAHGRLPRAWEEVPSFGPLPGSINWMVNLLPYLEQEALYGQARQAYFTQAIGTITPPHTGLTTIVKVYTCPADGRLSQPITDDKGYTAAYGSYWGVYTSLLKFEGFERVHPIDGAMPGKEPVRFLDISDGTSSTLLIGEKIPLGKYLAGNWYANAITLEDLMAGDSISSGISSSMMSTNLTRIGPCQGPFRYGPSRVTNPCDATHFGSLHPGGSNFVLCDGSVRFIAYSAVDLMPALASRNGGEIVDVP